LTAAEILKCGILELLSNLAEIARQLKEDVDIFLG
jgi:hypothetical protein